mgnify:CR=1 FL=1
MSVTTLDDFQIVPADREKEKATGREAVASNSRGDEYIFAPGWAGVQCAAGSYPLPSLIQLSDVIPHPAPLIIKNTAATLTNMTE